MSIVKRSDPYEVKKNRVTVKKLQNYYCARVDTLFYSIEALFGLCRFTAAPSQIGPFSF